MGNILDYLDWRGDITFEQASFNEVDNLILACFSYLEPRDTGWKYSLSGGAFRELFCRKKGRKN